MNRKEEKQQKEKEEEELKQMKKSTYDDRSYYTQHPTERSKQ